MFFRCMSRPWSLPAPCQCGCSCHKTSQVAFSVLAARLPDAHFCFPLLKPGRGSCFVSFGANGSPERKVTEDLGTSPALPCGSWTILFVLLQSVTPLQSGRNISPPHRCHFTGTSCRCEWLHHGEPMSRGSC